ncbi:MAG: hypothetical protein ACEY3D_04450 [Rickettsia sp.]
MSPSSLDERCCMARKICRVLYRGLSTVSSKTTQNTNIISIFNWIP